MVTTTIVLDSMTGANGTYLTVHSPEIGGAWAAVTYCGSSSAPGQLNGSGALVVTGVNHNTYLNAAATTKADQTVSIEFTPTGTNWIIGAVLRNQGEGAAGQSYWMEASYTGTVSINYSAAGSATTTSNIGGTASHGIAASDTNPHTIVISVIDDVFTVTIDGVEQTFSSGPPTNSSLALAGTVGMRCRAVNIDSFVAAGVGGVVPQIAMHYQGLH